MNALDDCLPDVMQVCRNGHVITDRLRASPEDGLSHCDRCGAPTIDHCLTCGQGLPGALPVPGLVPVGRSHPPRFCAGCGAAFPWTHSPPAATPSSPLAVLETLLRRLPLAARQLRFRHGNRSPFRMEDVHDLEDLLRALLPLHFDQVRLETRTPSYSPDSRTDLFLAAQGTAIAVKWVRPEVREPQLVKQWAEDAVYYRQRGGCRVLLGLVYDPEGLLVDPQGMETMGAGESAEDMEVRIVTAR